MTHENNVLIVNKQELLRAAIAMERESFFLSFLLLQCVAQLEDINRKLHTVMVKCETNPARDAFFELFMPASEWGKVFNEDVIEQWQAEFQEELDGGGLYSQWADCKKENMKAIHCMVLF